MPCLNHPLSNTNAFNKLCPDDQKPFHFPHLHAINPTMTTGPKAKSSCCFICFTNAAAVDDDDVEFQSKLKASKASKSDRKRNRVPRRILSMLFRSSKSNSLKSGDLKQVSNSSELVSSTQNSLPKLPEKPVEDDCQLSKSLSSSFSSSSLSSSSSSLSSSSSCPSFVEPEQAIKSTAKETEPAKTPQASAEERKRSSAKGLFVLLVSLSLIVLCGRLSAIVLMSSWLCFNARRSSDLGPVALSLPEKAGGGKALLRQGSKVEEKRRVVLEGLLERNRKSFRENYRVL